MGIATVRGLIRTVWLGALLLGTARSALQEFPIVPSQGGTVPRVVKSGVAYKDFLPWWGPILSNRIKAASPFSYVALWSDRVSNASS
jgi:hypothetical protein